MALSATIHKLQLSISDIDRNHYQDHVLTLAQHPSETVDRLLVRILAFLFDADEKLLMTRGISSSDEPDLWQHSDDGQIQHWIEAGLPEAARVKKASHRAQRVTVYCYGDRKTDIWWQQNNAALMALDNVNVVLIEANDIAQLQPLLARHMKWQCTVQDNSAWISAAANTAGGTTTVTPRALKSATRNQSRWG
jgi:uncharacterized protein YaeQ